MTKLSTAVLIAIVTGAGTVAAWGKAPEDKAVKILVHAESIRAPEQAELKVQLDTQAGKRSTSYRLKVLKSSQKRAHIDFQAPAEEKGRRMLAKGRLYWSTFPDSKRVVAISPREMIGNSAFALADVFQLDPVEDYKPKIVGQEPYAGMQTLKLELTSKHEDTPYHRIWYYVRAKDHYPVAAQFFGISGKKLKTMTIEASRQLAGRMRPATTKMIDNVTKARESTWMTQEMTKSKIPDHVFSKEFLKQQL